jgi:hypothetical protein
LSLAHQQKERGRRERRTSSITIEEESLPVNDTAGGGEE